ncbi:response regulator [Robbsia sp. KACC 23696]|uniref:response regulator n=1 Tax=Robbsia sp. KACC 23696 TaxID=3149231 RepID=UPI00325AF48E
MDDIRPWAKAITAWLEDNGFEVAVTYAGPEAIAKCVAWQPDVALLDVLMPGCSGLDVAIALRDNPITNQVYRVAVSGLNARTICKFPNGNCFDAYFQKGHRMTDLARIITQSVQTRSLANGIANGQKRE